ncbi:extracellular solute-binding protein [Alphaproteobacteria bacterium]|nr:extracellular solute-binding protein [Alphaproteobacteria bacterium]MDA8710849.1 extracellular solute-binding protein [Alphaproteobacteria bacterium]MDB0034192.1 extracellular solute-binding protein [Alphaproteobacteria bacterium]MDB2370907.1 extracellular solute-binding protein [Alphaproteobacteria bacterium]
MKTKLVLLSAFLGFLLAPMFSYAQTIKIYSERQPLLIEPLLKEFEEKTTIKVQWIYSQKGLVQKIILEKNRPVADVYLSSDISRLIDIAEAGATIQLNQGFQVPSYLQSDDWVGLTQRARVFFVSDKFANQDLSYEDLIDDQFQGRVCTRSGFHPYNISLFASLLAHHGEEWLREYLTTLKNNLARKPQGNDRDQVKAIYAGVCDISIGNHYYYFQMMENEDQKKWLEKAKIIFPNQTNRGAHVNISGIALLKEETREISEQLIAFLLSDAAQTVYANDNNEFPVSPTIPVSSQILELGGEVIFDDLELSKIAESRSTVIQILNQINFDG